MNVLHKPENPAAPSSDDEEKQKANDHESFVVSASSSLSELRPLILKYGDSFGVFDTKGDALASQGGTQGLYYRDTRHLSHFSVTLNGRRPLVLSSTLRDDNATLTCDLANPDMFDEAGRLVVEHDLIHVRRTRFLWKAGCFERICIRNFDEAPQRLQFGNRLLRQTSQISLRFAACRARDAARFIRRSSPATRCGCGIPGLTTRQRLTTLRFDPAPDSVSANQATFDLQLAPKETRSIFLEIDCQQGEFIDSAR